MLEGGHSSPRRLPFSFQTSGSVGRLSLAELAVGPLLVERLELEVDLGELGTHPGTTVAERFQRRRSRLRALAVRLTGAALDERVAQLHKPLAALGISQLSARLNDGFISVRARAADGLAAADLSFRIQLVNTGAHLRALASTIRVHGHLPTPGPVIADRIQAALLGASELPGSVERPSARGLCDVEIDLVGGVLWHLMPPNGWRLPAVAEIELTALRIGRAAIEIAFGPAGTRTGELGVRPATQQLAAAHDLMHSVDDQLRSGHLEDGMRGYRALLAAGGPDQPLLLERILALAAARPSWFFDGLELARQALGRWPQFPPAHAALASITLAQGDAREAAGHLTQLAQLASGDGDDDQAALAALAGARLLRVLEPRAATQLYQLALEHDPGSAEAADSLADRLADEQRWPELVRLVRARAVITAEPARAVQLRLRLADVFVRQLHDPDSAQLELAAARAIAPGDPAVHEMTAAILTTSDPPAAVEAWREVGRLAELRGDHRIAARAWASVGGLLAEHPALDGDPEAAWRRAVELDPLQPEALAGLAHAAAARGDHGGAAELFERLRGLGLAPQLAARHELALARSLVATSRLDDARSSLRRATLAGGEPGAEAHALLGELAEASGDHDHAAAELDTAIVALVELAGPGGEDEARWVTRAAQLSIARAGMFDRAGAPEEALRELERAHQLAELHAPELARAAARTLLERAEGDFESERRWLDGLLATRPPTVEHA
ncbi:MAG: tetratricopeptide repeat protein, partial [Kofleriaceae bacterium]